MATRLPGAPMRRCTSFGNGGVPSARCRRHLRALPHHPSTIPVSFDLNFGSCYLPLSVFFCKSEKLTLSSQTISPRFQSGFNSKIICPPQDFV